MKIEGLPEGYEISRIGRPIYGELVLGGQGNVFEWGVGVSDIVNHVILRKVERPKTYRPFANAEEFKPHRDRWVKRGRYTVRISFFCDDFLECDHCVFNWVSAYNALKFDDGSPFGVGVSE